ncbi:hypothetical protein INR49_032494 [Caranx melampygus]|nr:hypothetical protein INR49_032494 [Caranx melampygus]
MCVCVCVCVCVCTCVRLFLGTSIISLFVEINGRQRFKPVPAEHQYRIFQQGRLTDFTLDEMKHLRIKGQHQKKKSMFQSDLYVDFNKAEGVDKTRDANKAQSLPTACRQGEVTLSDPTQSHSGAVRGDARQGIWPQPEDEICG